MIVKSIDDMYLTIEKNNNNSHLQIHTSAEVTVSTLSIGLDRVAPQPLNGKQ